MSTMRNCQTYLEYCRMVLGGTLSEIVLLAGWFRRKKVLDDFNGGAVGGGAFSCLYRL